MHDYLLVAVDAALRTPRTCGCGRPLMIVERDGALWLECPSLADPSRLPARVAAAIRAAMHDRQFVIDLPAPEPVPVRPARRAARGAARAAG